jgi:hypothetical protein
MEKDSVASRFVRVRLRIETAEEAQACKQETQANN